MKLRAILTVFLFGLCLQAGAATPSRLPDRLRQLVQLPRLDMQVQFMGYTPGEGFTVLNEASLLLPETERVRRELQGDDRDAERLFLLSQLQRKLGNGVAQQTLDEATAMLRRRVEADPQNAILIARLGEARAAAGETTEGETLMRRAVTLAPRNADIRIGLGGLLVNRSVAILMGFEDAATNRPPTSMDMLGRILERPPSAAELERSQQLTDEGLQAHEEAVRLAPEDAEVVSRRGICRSFHQYAREILKTAAELKASGKRPEAMELFGAMFPDACVADLRRAAELDPKNPRRITSVTMADLIRASVAQKEAAFGSAEAWGKLPGPVRASALADLERLMNLAEASDPLLAASASECAGILQFMIMHDLTGAATSLRRALSLNPRSESAWDMLVGTYVTGGKFEEFLPTAEQQLKRADTWRNRIILAKVLEKLDRHDQAGPHVRAALAQAPEGVIPNLAMAAWYLKNSRDGDDLTPVVSYLARAGHNLERAPDRNPFLDLQMLRALYFGLSGKQEMARQILRKVLGSVPDDDRAKAILSALGDTNG